MSVFNPQHHLASLRTALQQSSGYTVVCYCAAWCDSCKKYETDFAQLASQHSEHVFVWVDIEENPELLGDDDVENFPTILVQNERDNLFFGPLLPHIGHLDRLLRSLHTTASPVPEGPPALMTLLAPPAQ